MLIATTPHALRMLMWLQGQEAHGWPAHRGVTGAYRPRKRSSRRLQLLWPRPHQSILCVCIHSDSTTLHSVTKSNKPESGYKRVHGTAVLL